MKVYAKSNTIVPSLLKIYKIPTIVLKFLSLKWTFCRENRYFSFKDHLELKYYILDELIKRLTQIYQIIYKDINELSNSSIKV